MTPIVITPAYRSWTRTRVETYVHMRRAVTVQPEEKGTRIESEKCTIDNLLHGRSHAEISYKLAVAIGWNTDDIQTILPSGADAAEVQVWYEREWRTFDYRDWSVAGPIAEKYGVFPSMYLDERARIIGWENHRWEHPDSDKRGQLFMADTPQKAIAIAIVDNPNLWKFKKIK